jgi:hypothetical protein
MQIIRSDDTMISERMSLHEQDDKTLIVATYCLRYQNLTTGEHDNKTLTVAKRNLIV